MGLRVIWTLPIRSHAPDLEHGIVYIGDGGLGVPQRTPDPNRWWLQKPGFATSVHHMHLLEFGEETLRVRALGMEGGVLDDFELKPRMVAVVE
jgi:acid phosphatase type 7